MKTSRTPSAAKRTAAEVPPQIAKRWSWHYQKLGQLGERLLDERGEQLREAAAPIEPHSMHQADSATDEFDHELALGQLSAEQDALYEVEAAMKRITDGSYGVCEQTGKRIPAARLKAVPWTRFREEVEARLEGTGMVPRPRLGKLRSLRGKTNPSLAASEQTVERRARVEPAVEAAEEPTET